MHLRLQLVGCLQHRRQGQESAGAPIGTALPQCRRCSSPCETNDLKWQQKKKGRNRGIRENRAAAICGRKNEVATGGPDDEQARQVDPPHHDCRPPFWVGSGGLDITLDLWTVRLQVVQWQGRVVLVETSFRSFGLVWVALRLSLTSGWPRKVCNRASVWLAQAFIR